jgi:hypothetical protein
MKEGTFHQAQVLLKHRKLTQEGGGT